jgi:TolB-like protein/Tfp pilus assembly protein PilF
VGLAVIGGVLAVGDRLPQIAKLRPTEQERSIAVLPFTTLGAQAEAGALADGLTEEVINSLAQYPDLKVSGRTSAFYFKDKTPDLQEVGRKLGVAYVVKGSVRPDGDRLRVTAQLVEVANGFTVWSATYDRRTTDAFAIQDELVSAVAGELKAGSGVATRSTRAPDARTYQLYLVAKANLRDGGTAQLATARRLFERQLAVDPDDPRALAGYAEATIGLARKFELPFEPARAASEAAVARALRADPNSAEAYLARSRIEELAANLTNQPGHAGQALEAAKRAVELAPRNAEALTSYGFQLVIVTGETDKAIEILERAVKLDPLQRSAQAQLGKIYRAAGLPRRAAAQYRATIELFPDYPEARILLGEVLYELGDVVAADRAYREAAPGFPIGAAMYRARLYANLQMNKEAVEQLSTISAPKVAAFSRALERHLVRDYRGALALAEAEVARDPDAQMRDILYANATILGDYAKARRHMPELAPGLLSAEPSFPASALDLAAFGAHILNRTGEQAQARKVIARTLKLAAPRPGRESLPMEWLARISAYAELGDTERALAEMRRAIDAGYHDRVDEGIFVRLEDWPSLRPLRGDPRFQRMIAEIEAGNSAQRQKLLGSRPSAAVPQAK